MPTDKPSRLFIDIDNDKLTITNNPIGGEHMMNQNIYITSDEEIKAGDWFYDDEVDEILKAGENVDLHLVNNLKPNFKKIILTTNAELVKDGVQAIDDEFLEWFVENPSCEMVEVKPLLSNNGRALFGYKIIIPK